MSEAERELPDSSDSEWLQGQLEVCAEGPDEPILPGDICGEGEPVVPLPDDLSRASCSCSQKCITRATKNASRRRMVHDLRGEVCDQHFLLELVKHAHQSGDRPRSCDPPGSGSTRHRWHLAGLPICVDAFVVLLGISKVRLAKVLTSIRTSGITPLRGLP